MKRNLIASTPCANLYKNINRFDYQEQSNIWEINIASYPLKQAFDLPFLC
jgi:hypothetical protein